MKTILRKECYYCGKVSIMEVRDDEYVFKHCEVCKDKHCEIIEYQKNKIDYYKGCPAFVEKKTDEQETKSLYDDYEPPWD